MDHEPNNPRTVANDDTDAALLALANSRELQRVLIALLRVGKIKAVYEGPTDPQARMDVAHYKFHAPHPEPLGDAALSPEELRRYRAYEARMMETGLYVLAEAVENLHRAHADVRLPEHECDVVDWPTTIEQIRAVDNAFHEVLDVLQDEISPHVEALDQLAQVRRKELAMLEALGAMDTAPPREL